ncbi:MAG TPA: alpha/beta fold hydrolase [Phenylobacterium sp.]|uniref:alpha/beta fold hydrolase n=1 Tax=Phenylobacterium sp. TaxID=1871053 RepID=UPI002B9AB651|nr:alpha/beta fold hydrolase [Phenylobacterium sp.]HSV04593.1 alpha/beta fold hydrolase [Phenylobacterium sp.]
MPRFVLLPSPVLGPYSWRAVAEALGGQVLALPRLSSLGGSYYEQLAEAAAAQIAPGEPAVLVAHSGAGALVPAVAARRALAGAILVDAILPHPGRSWFDTAPAELRHHLRSGARDGRLPAWDEWWPPGALERLVPDEAAREALIAELEPIPVAWFEEVAPAGESPERSAYLKLSEAYEDEARAANRLGWPLVRLPLNHLAPVSQPTAVASAITGLAERLSA